MLKVKIGTWYTTRESDTIVYIYKTTDSNKYTYYIGQVFRKGAFSNFACWYEDGKIDRINKDELDLISEISSIEAEGCIKDYSVASPQFKKEPAKCVCDMQTLLMNGCKCGGV